MCPMISLPAAIKRFCRADPARHALPLKRLIGKGDVQFFAAGKRCHLAAERVRAAHDERPVAESLGRE